MEILKYYKRFGTKPDSDELPSADFIFEHDKIR